MGIYIKGMEMPTSCEDCPMAFAVNFGILCTPTKRIVGDGEISKKQGFCPLVPVPAHGRLIDADDALIWFVCEGQRSKRYKIGERWELNCEEINKVISSLQTIIPESEEG